MKYIVFILFTGCFLSSCNRNRMDEYPTDEHIPWQSVTEYEYHGHSYIKFSSGRQGGVVHNPDCKCLKIY